MKCMRCGHDGGTWNFRKFYSCKAPLCKVKNMTFCQDCLKEMGAEENFWGPKTCPVCKVGELKSHGF